MSRQGSLLVVENDDLIRDLLAEALALEGYAVRSASDRTTMHAALTAQAPDLVIYDVDLDRGPDSTLMDDVRATYDRAVPILLLTTNGWTARSLARQGLIFCLLKPFQVDDLFAYVAEQISTNMPVRAREVGAAFGAT